MNTPSLYASLFETVKFCKEKDGSEIEIVVPDKLSLFMEKFLFEQMDISASFNIKVSTFNRFAKRTCPISKDNQISKTGSILLIHKILNQNLNNLKVLKSKAYSFSYAEEIFKTISQLKASKIGFEEMLKFNTDEQQLKDKINDLALVYSQYEMGKAGKLDASDLFLASVFTIVEDKKEDTNILFVGFDDFTAIEYLIIEQLAKNCKVFVLANYSIAKNKFIYNDEIYEQLKNIAFINQLPFDVEYCDYSASSLKAFLESNVFAINNNQYVLTDEIVKLINANNIEQEIDFVARDIRSNIVEGKRYDKFGVAVYGLENHINKIKEIFSKYEINYYIDAELKLTKSCLYKFFLSVLRYNLDGYNLCNLIDIINSPFFVMEANAKNVLTQKLVSVDFAGKVNNDFCLSGVDSEIQQQFKTITSSLIFDYKISVNELILKLKNFCEQIKIEEILTNIAQNDVLNSILLKKSYSLIFELFDEIIEYHKDIDVLSFADIFMHIADVVKINNLPQTIDAVKVVDANNTMEIFEHYYMINTTAQNAPNLKYDCGIILDAEIDKLNFANKLSPSIAHINKLSKLRLFNSMLLFEKELTISYNQTPSEIVKELSNKLCVKLDGEILNIEPIKILNFDKYNALTKWDYIDAVCKYNKNYIKNQKINENIIKNKNFNNISNKNLEIYKNLKNISASQLENYFRCPFNSFMANVLKIRPRLDNDILSFDIGNVLHEIVYLYYKRKKQVGDIYDFCKNQVLNFVENDARLKMKIDSPILVNLIDEAVRVVNGVNYIDANSAFVPKFFEYEFKGDRALKLNNINVIGKIDRVDQAEDILRVVDYKSGIADATLKELYYGNKLQLFLYSCAMEDVLNKKTVGAFYLPLHNVYTDEIKNNYALQGFYLAEDFVANALDRRLQPGEKSDIVNLRLTNANKVRKYGSKELGSEDLLNLKNYSKAVTEKAVDEIKSGYIKPSPSVVSSPCEYCPYVHICLKNSNDIRYRKAKTVNLASFEGGCDE